ncbi:MAG: ATP-binding protein [Desulfobacteraceae bacterium]|jgi:two-component system phosphate regulon sensor histidine kinase PhoR
MAKKKRLLWQLYPTYIIIVVVSLLAATWFASRTLKQFYHEQSASDLEARALLFKSQILEHLSPLDAGAVDRLCKKVGGEATTRITVILPSGKVIGDSEKDPEKMDNHVDRPEVIQALSGKVGMSTRYSRTLEKEMMYVGIPLKRNFHVVGVVRTSVPLISIDKAMKSIQAKIAIGGLLIAVLAAILSLLVSRRISRPIEEIRKGAECFAQGDFECRLPVSGSEELGSLSETMNQMAIELQERINGMREQRNELEAVLSSMVEGVIALDQEERVISINQAAAQMFKTNPSSAQGRSIQEVVRNSDLQNFARNALSGEGPVECDIVLYSDGERVLNGHSTVLHDAGGNRIGALIVLNDVTRLRRLENIRRDFVANVSHEIKTPITAIKGFVETLREGAMTNSEDADRFLAIIQKHVDRLDAIIEDLLSLSRIEEDVETEEIVLEEGRIRDVLLTAIQVCQVKAAPKDIRMELSCSEDLKAKINPPLLEQAVVNLLDNAIKYSDAESEVQVEAKKVDSKILINVRDQGCGIDKRHLSRLFERFYRVDKARSRKMGGTGLGLAIVKHITQAHGGHVTVQSTPERGSTFSLHLPTNLT